MKAQLWVEKKWTPSLQRENDASLMQTFLDCPQISRAMLKKANAVRPDLRVVTITDLADVGGTFIPAGILTGKWQAGSDYKWLYQPMPPVAFWSTFRKCLRLTFCTNNPPYSHPTHSLRLDKPLGKWHIVPRNTWFTCYRSPTAIFWRKKNGNEVYAMTYGSAAGFYHIATTISTLPRDCHPIRFREIDNTIWTHGKYAPTIWQTRPTTPGAIVDNTITDERMEMITLGSDGSVNLREETATCAWMIHQQEGNHLKACYILENTTSLSSYQSELEGMYRGLKQVETLPSLPQYLNQWCDNKAAVDRCNTDLYTPGSLLQPNADVLMAIRHVRASMEIGVTCQHVYGHQDTKAPNRSVRDEEYDYDEQDDDRDIQKSGCSPAPNELTFRHG